MEMEGGMGVRGVLVQGHMNKKALPVHSSQVSYPFPIHGQDHSG